MNSYSFSGILKAVNDLGWIIEELSKDRIVVADDYPGTYNRTVVTIDVSNTYYFTEKDLSRVLAQRKLPEVD